MSFDRRKIRTGRVVSDNGPDLPLSPDANMLI